MPGGFNRNTRRKIVTLPVMTKGSGANTQSITLPKTGYLARLFLAIRGSVAGTLSAPNALGFSSILSRVKLTLNSGVDLFNVSGAGYHYLLRELLETELVDPVGASTGRTAITATTFNLDMVIPIALNMRDPLGLILLQNEATLAQLSVDFLADASVATGATVTCTVTPWMEIFTVPVAAEDQPDISLLHQILEDQQAVSAAGDFEYKWPRSNTYLQVMHGLGIGAAGADGFTNAAIRVNQSDYLQTTTPTFLDMEHRAIRGRARPAGGVFYDFLGTSGFGTYGTFRDLYDSSLITDLSSILNANAAGTLYTIRRQLVEI